MYEQQAIIICFLVIPHIVFMEGKTAPNYDSETSADGENAANGDGAITYGEETQGDSNADPNYDGDYDFPATGNGNNNDSELNGGKMGVNGEMADDKTKGDDKTGGGNSEYAGVDGIPNNGSRNNSRYVPDNGNMGVEGEMTDDKTKGDDKTGGGNSENAGVDGNPNNGTRNNSRYVPDDGKMGVDAKMAGGKTIRDGETEGDGKTGGDADYEYDHDHDTRNTSDSQRDGVKTGIDDDYGEYGTGEDGSYTIPLDPVKLGFLVPWDGEWILGPSCAGGILVAMDDIKDRELVSVALSWTWKDTNCNSKVGVTAALNLGTVDVFIGGGCSTVCEPVSLLSAAFQIPFISIGCTSAELSNKKSFDHFYRVVGTWMTLGPMFEIFLKRMAWKRVAIVTSTDRIFSDTGLEIRKALQQAGLTVFLHSVSYVFDGLRIVEKNVVSMLTGEAYSKCMRGCCSRQV